MDCLKAAPGRRHAVNRPSRDRRGKALYFMETKLAEAEKIAQQSPCGERDEDGPGLGQGLKARRKTRRVTNHSMLPQRTLTEAADDHQTGGYANADRQRLFRRRLQPCNRGSDIERRTHGSLGIVLVRTGITEISQYSVASEISEESVKSQRDAGTGGLKCINYEAHILWIESGRQGSRTHQIADHHSQVTALASSYGGELARRPPDLAGDSCTGKAPSHRLNRPDEALPVAQRHPELFKIVFAQLRQHIKVDSVLDERWLVLFESMVSQPGTHVHGSGLNSVLTHERTYQGTEIRSATVSI